LLVPDDVLVIAQPWALGTWSRCKRKQDYYIYETHLCKWIKDLQKIIKLPDGVGRF